MEISRIEMVLLGMIAKNPGYAYEIDQFIKETHMRRWVQIGSASVYQGLERLAKKGLARSRREKEGRMPVRRRYYLTDEGKETLRQAIKKLLSQSEDHYLDLNLGLFCSHVLEEEEIPDLLEERLLNLSSKSREIKSHEHLVSEDKIWQKNFILTALLEFCRTEEKMLRKTIAELRKNKG